jgi:crotonobetainyl-CoA:carnitine CoA-transferase CaiB-like acyl-CoA transferase
LAPFEAVRTSDGFLVLAPGTNRLFRDLCTVLGREDLATDDRFESNERRVLHRPALLEELEKSFTQRTTADWLDILEREQIPCAPVNTMAEAYRSEQLHANGMVQRVPHPTVGEVSQLSSPYHFGHGDLPIRLAPPLLGQHTDEVLRALLDMSPEQLASLHESGSI